MKKNLWIFPAIMFALLANLLLGEHKLVAFIFLLLWISRIFLLRDFKNSMQILFLASVFFAITLAHVFQNQTELISDDELFVVALDRNSFKIDGDYLSFIGTTTGNKGNKKEKLLVQHYIFTKEEKEGWQDNPVPTHILIKGELVEPSNNSNFNQFNYKKYLKRQKINWQLKAEKIQSISIDQLKPSTIQKIAEIRFKIINYLDNNFHNKVSSYLKILFIGEGSALDKNTKESYQALGLIHLFSISGFHISFLVKFIERFFLRIGISRERTNLILVIILPIYGLIAGLSISIFRAVTQKTIRVIGVIFNREIDSLDAWSLALILSLIINPYIVFELSFQLSYSLSALFILFGKRQWVQELNFLKQSVLFSILSSFISLPILAYHFYEISWLTIASNLVFIPVFSYFLFPTLFILLILSILFSHTIFFIHLNKIIAIFLTQLESVLVGLTQRYDFTFVVGRLPYLTMIVLIVMILVSFKKIEKKTFPSFFILFPIFICLMWNRWLPISYVVILDVGQGDSILIKEAKTGKVTLIDTGGRVQWQEKKSGKKEKKNSR